jgi:DNA-binding winged helix-turn-helix (wHTH) protein
MQFRFGEFVLDDELRALLRSSQSLPLSPKAYELLHQLLARRPAIVGRDELAGQLWPDTSVGYTSLPRVVAELRRVLGDEARDPRFVRTVHGVGYAFCGSAREEPRPGRTELPCALRYAGRELGLGEGETVIGRGEECALHIDSAKVSRRHARVVVAGREARLEDLGSKNGTFLNGRRIESPGLVPLHEGDEILIGATLLVFHERFGPGSTLTG